jgi:hypothetical protein
MVKHCCSPLRHLRSGDSTLPSSCQGFDPIPHHVGCVSQLWEAETQLRNTLREQVDLSHQTLTAQVEKETQSGGGIAHRSPRCSRESGTAREAQPLVDAASPAPSPSAQACVPANTFVIIATSPPSRDRSLEL